MTPEEDVAEETRTAFALRDRVYAEGTDLSWARDQESSLSRAVAASSVELVAVHCGVTMCEVEIVCGELGCLGAIDRLVHENAEAFHTEVHGYFGPEVRPDHARLYVARDGHRLGLELIRAEGI